MKERLADALRALAAWLDGATVRQIAEFEPAALEHARQLVARAHHFADGTSGEYKRAWVWGKMLRLYPSLPKTSIGLLIEIAVQHDRRGRGEPSILMTP